MSIYAAEMLANYCSSKFVDYTDAYTFLSKNKDLIPHFDNIVSEAARIGEINPFEVVLRKGTPLHLKGLLSFYNIHYKIDIENLEDLAGLFLCFNINVLATSRMHLLTLEMTYLNEDLVDRLFIPELHFSHKDNSFVGMLSSTQAKSKYSRIAFTSALIRNINFRLWCRKNADSFIQCEPDLYHLLDPRIEEKFNLIPKRIICDCISNYLFTEKTHYGYCKHCIEAVETLAGVAGVDIASEKLNGREPDAKLILDSLNRYVFKQNKAKEDLALALHFYIKGAELKKEDSDLLQQNSMFIIGNTGVGKTYIVEVLKKTLPKLPIFTINAAMLTPGGYVGNNSSSVLEKIAKELCARSRGTRYDTNYIPFILHFDEIDKLVVQGSADSKEFYGKVQGELLKVFDSGIGEEGSGLHKPFFIFTGSFNNQFLHELQEDTKGSIGFGNKLKEEVTRSHGFQGSVSDLQTKLISMGVMPEMIGRVQNFAILEELDENDYFRMLTEIKNSPLQQVQKHLELADANHKFTNKRLKEVCKIAQEKALGVRGLRAALMEDVREILKEKLLTEK